MKVLVTGACGQLGCDVIKELSRRGADIAASDISDGLNFETDYPRLSYVPMDFTDSEAVSDVMEKVCPDAVVHCGAWTQVDKAEENREAVMAVNGTGTENIAAAAEASGAKLVYLSTDYVFSGEGSEPWKADCTDFAPLNVYGESKLAGEKAVISRCTRFFIVRISWVFGRNGGNFVKTMLRLGEKYDSLRVVNDQTGTPTYTADLARLLCDMIETDRYGVYHASNDGGYISWADFAAEIFRQAGKSTRVIPVTTEEYGLSRAARPFNSRLDKSKLTEKGFSPLPDWKDALRRYLKEIDVI